MIEKVYPNRIISKTLINSSYVSINPVGVELKIVELVALDNGHYEYLVSSSIPDEFIQCIQENLCKYSLQSINKPSNSTIMVAAFAQSKKRQIQDAHRRLKQAHANIIGVLFTKVKTGGSYGGYNYDYEYYYSYGNDRLTDKSSA